MPVRGVSCIVSKLEFYNAVWSDQDKIVTFTSIIVCVLQLGHLLPLLPVGDQWELLEEPSLQQAGSGVGVLRCLFSHLPVGLNNFLFLLP